MQDRWWRDVFSRRAAACWIAGFALLLPGMPSGQRAVAADAPVLRDCTECPELVAIPAGSVVLGAAPGEEARENLADAFRDRSQPQRNVQVRAFHAGRHEITRAQYRAFVEATGHVGPGCFVWTGEEFTPDPNKDWRAPGFGQQDTHPAICVSWDDAQAYLHWLGTRTGRRYRLLTEAEWEYAARAGTTTARYWGEDSATACAHANGADAATAAAVPAAGQWPVARCNDRYPYTAPVGSFPPNAFGLYDMLGNAAEWTQDCWNPDYRSTPVDGSAAVSGDCGMRAVRGGAWNDAPVGVRAAYRVGSPTVIRVESRGFRIARD